MDLTLSLETTWLVHHYPFLNLALDSSTFLNLTLSAAEWQSSFQGHERMGTGK